MASSRRNSTMADPFKLTILILAIIAFLYFAGEVLKPLALSILLSFALTPICRLLERARLPRAAAVVLTVVLTLGVLGGIGYVVGQQLTALANKLPDYQQNIESKLAGVIQPGETSAAQKLKNMADEVTAHMEKPVSEAGGKIPIQRVEVVSRPSIQDQLRSAIGPYLEFLGVGSFVLVLVLFMLMERGALSDRIIGLFGHRQVSLTTRTMQEIGQRITRYLATFALVNSAFGLVIGLGLALIGVPYPVLWGCLAGLLRFIPYVGPAVAFILPLVFSFAHFPGWLQPIGVFVIYAVVETILNSYLEPVIYGKTTGVTALGLLVAAMFWTWLWGTIGLLLSTPLTVCLAVLGKYVPNLSFFAAILGEEADLDPDVRFYQRLVALDRDGAIEVAEAALASQPRVEVFDQMLIPALSRAEHDTLREDLNEMERTFVWRVVGEVLDQLDSAEELDLSIAAHAKNEGAEHTDEPGELEILGVPVQDVGDVLVLRMLSLLLAPSGLTLKILDESESPMKLAQEVAEASPRLVVVSHLPPDGLTSTRYLVRRLRAHSADVPLIVGRWGRSAGAASERLNSAGATQTVTSLAEARKQIEHLAIAAPKHEVASAPLP